MGYIESNINALSWIGGGYTGINDIVLLPDGDWSRFLPEYEAQKRNGFDTYGCSSFAELNCLEILMKYNGQTTNYSDRYVVVGSGTIPNVGNTIEAPADFIRKNGVVFEELCQWENGEDKYYQPIEQRLFDVGKLWLKKYTYNYQRIRPEHGKYIETVKYYLQRSPLKACCRYAFGTGILNPQGGFNHFVTLYKIDNEAQYVFDHYDGGFKRYSLNYQFILQGSYLTIKNENMELKEGEVYHLVEGSKQALGLVVDGKLMIGSEGQEIWVLLNASGRKKVALGEIKPIPTNLSDWNSVKHYNLKGEQI